MSLFPRVFASEFAPVFRLMDDYASHVASRGSFGPSFPRALRSFQPRFDVKESKEAYELQGELPGIDQKDLNIEFTDANTLSIKGRTDRSREEGTRPAAIEARPEPAKIAEGSDSASETSSYFGEACEAVVRGPLEQDVYQLNDAMKGAGTKEAVLNDVLLGRSNADMRAIKNEYQRVYRRSLEQDLRGDLSVKTETLFVMVVAANRAEESAPVIPQAIEHDISQLWAATEGTKFGTDQMTVCQIFATRSDGQLRAISHAFQAKYHKSLMKTVESEFSGHMEGALMRMLGVAEDRAMADAVVRMSFRKRCTRANIIHRLLKHAWLVQGQKTEIF